MASDEISAQSEAPLVWEEYELFPPLDPENFSEGEDESSDVDIFVSDHDVLDCSICCEPLKPPIYQCLVGHVCCSSCYQRINDKCHICCRTSGHNRCFAMEKLVSSMKVTCTNKKYGCDVIMPYYELKEHEQTCFHQPCYCPYWNCLACGCRRSFRKHMGAVHKERIIDFPYDKLFKVVLPKACTFKVLAEQDYIFYLHKRDEGFLGVQTLSVFCMRPPHLNATQFWYEIKTDRSVGVSEDRYVQMWSKVENRVPKGDFERSKFCLLVLPEFCLANGDIHVFVRIKKIQSKEMT